MEKMSESLISSFLVSDVRELLRCSPKMSDVSKSLRLLSKMSIHERFAKVAQRKWAIVSELLRSLTKNERMSESFIFLCANRSFAHFWAKKRAIRSENWWANFQPCKYCTVHKVKSRGGEWTLLTLETKRVKKEEEKKKLFRTLIN